MALPRAFTATPMFKTKMADGLFHVRLKVVDGAVANRGTIRVVCESEAIADDIFTAGVDRTITVT